MADRKISQLTEIEEFDVNNDVLAVVDTSVPQTKKTTIKDLVTAVVSQEVVDYAALDALTGGVEVGETVRRTDIDQLYTLVNSGGHITTTGGFSFDVVTGGSKHNVLAHGDIGGGENCADVIEAAAQAVYDAGGGALVFPSGVYTVERTVELPLGVSIEGASPIDNLGPTGSQVWDKGTIFKPVTGGSYTDDYVFLCNIAASDTTTWVQQFPNIIVHIGGFTFDASDSDDGKNGFLFGGTYEFENIRNRGVKTLIAKPEGLYTDGVKAAHIHSTARADQTSYLIDLPGLGDAYVIHNIGSGYAGSQVDMTKGVRLGPVRSSSVFGLINGGHRFEGGGVYDIYGLHLEGGDVEIDDPQGGCLHSSYFATEDEENGVPVKITGSSSTFGKTYAFAVRDNVFNRTMNRRGGWPTTEIFDIAIDASVTVDLQNNVRRVTAAGNTNIGQAMGILISDDGGTAIDSYNDYSHVLSGSSCRIVGGRAVYHDVVPAQVAAITGLNAPGLLTFDDVTFNGATATYYYNSIVLMDPVRLAGRNTTGGEVSQAATNGGDLVKLNWTWGLAETRGNVIVRVYRGTSSGAYDEYVDMPVLALGRLIDVGHAINGFVWQSRTSGGVDSMNAGLVGAIDLSSEEGTTLRTNAGRPTLGTWRIHDTVLIRVPSDGASGTYVTTGYRRRVAGTTHTTTSGSNPDWLVLQAYLI